MLETLSSLPEDGAWSHPAFSSCTARTSTCSAAASRTSTAPPRWRRSTSSWQALAGELGVQLETIQSNHEGALIDFLHQHIDDGAGRAGQPGRADAARRAAARRDQGHAVPGARGAHVQHRGARGVARALDHLAGGQGHDPGPGPALVPAGPARRWSSMAREAAAAADAWTPSLDAALPPARGADRRLPGGHGRAGVRQRGAALRLQLGHHGVGGGVALALHLDAPSWAPSSALREHGHLGIDMVVGRLRPARQEGLPGRRPTR